MFALLRAGHLPPVVAVTAIATALAVAAGRGFGAVAVAAAVGAGQLAVGWSNDYIDRERDLVAGRRDKPIVMGQVEAGVVRRAAVVAALACVPLSLLSGWRSGALHLSAVAVAWLYNIRLKATIASVVPYVVAFGSLPAVVTLGLGGHPWPPWWASVAAALLGSGAHFINTLADIDDDLGGGVRGLPQRLGHNTSLLLGVLLMTVASAVLAWAPRGRPGLAVQALVGVTWLLAGGVVVAARSAKPRNAWSLTIALAVVAVTLLLASGRTLA